MHVRCHRMLAGNEKHMQRVLKEEIHHLDSNQQRLSPND